MSTRQKIACLLVVLMTPMHILVLAEEPVYFADPALKAAVEDELGICDPTPTDMLNLYELWSAVNAGIADLTGLEYMTNLTDLYLYDNQISNISPLSRLTNLTDLLLRANPISDISPLSGLTNLSFLVLEDNQIIDISPLSGLTNLTRLVLSNNQIGDISRLSGLTNLYFLYMHDNQISDISALSGLTNLTYLSLDGNQISEISTLSGLTNLNKVYLGDNQISDISPISGLTNLSHLDLRINPLNAEAYDTYIPLIQDNNPGIELLYGPYPNLVVDSLSISKDILVQHDSATISCTIRNQGDADATPVNYWLRIRLSDGMGYDESDTYVAGRQIGINLGPGESDTEEFNFNSSEYGTGDFYVVAKIDATNIVEECGEGDNTESTPITIEPTQCCRVYGYVLYSTGYGFGGVEVRLTGNGEDRIDVTQNDGYYDFEGLADGTYNVNALKEGWEFTNNPQAAIVSGANLRLLDMIATHETISTPGPPSGEISPVVDTSYIYTTSGATSSVGHTVEYQFDWDDGTASEWSTLKSASHAWTSTGTRAITVTARCQIHNDKTNTSDPLEVTVAPLGETISKPGTPTGQTKPIVDLMYTYTTSGATSNLGHTVEYQFDWGDGDTSGWSCSKSASHAWTSTGTQAITVTARCQIHTDKTNTSDRLQVTLIPPTVTIQGTVYDAASSEPIAGADVSIPGQPMSQTDEFGEVGFSNLPIGETTVSVSKTGYYPVTQPVTINAGSKHVSIVMTPVAAGGTEPVVAEIRSNFCNPSKHTYYLDGVSLTEIFTATIDWRGHTPGVIRWITPSATYEDVCSGTTALRSFDMGSEFGIGGRLTVVAVAAGDMPQSAPKQANFNVLPPPPGVPSILLRAETTGGKLKYSAKWLVTSIIDQGIDADEISDEIPGFGGRAFDFVLDVMVKAEIKTDGSASYRALDGYEVPPISIGGGEISPKVTVEFGWRYSSADGAWTPNGFLEVVVEGRYDTPPQYYVIFVGPVPVPVYWRLALEAAISPRVDLVGWDFDNNTPILEGTLPLSFGAEIMIGAGIADVLAVEGYFNGTVSATFKFPREEPLEQFCIELSGGARVVVFVFLRWDWEIFRKQWCYPEEKTLRSLILEEMSSRPVGEFQVMPRDYLGLDYAIWSPGLVRTKVEGMTFLEADSGAPCEPDTEQLLQYNVFGQSQPTIAADGNDLLLAWIYDDPNRDPGDMNSLNRTEVVFSECREGQWSEPVAIDDDGTSDFSPQIIVLADGNALCAWENAKRWLANDANLSDMSAAIEIAAAHYDSSSGMWSVQALTDNGHLDRTPRIAAAADGTAIAVWVENEKNDILGLDPNAANTIRYSLWDGTSWSEPNSVAQEIGLIIKTTLAYNGDEAAYVYTIDADHDWVTETDREVYTVPYDGNDWWEPYRVTNDTLLDANPQAGYDQNDLLLVWYRDANLVSLRNFDPNSLEEVLQTSGSSGSMDFRLAKSPGGQVSLVWTEASAAGVDIFTATYDAGLSIWSQPYELTSDRAMERSISATYAGRDELALAYNKVEIIDHNGIPEPNRVDLYVLRHSISSDLSISARDISPSVANPTPGSTVDVNAVIHNLGDVAEVNVPVAFYEGHPDANGVLIEEMQVIEGPIPAGASAVASVSWLVPEVNEPLEIYVVVDPCFVLEDSDRSNNVASISPLAADLTVTSISSERIGPKKRVITARVANVGTLPAENVAVVVSRDSPSGPELASYSITELGPNTFHDVWHVWDIATEEFNDVEVSVCVDVDRSDEIVEMNEENNTAIGLIQVGKVADVTDNGRIDFVDCAKLADSWLEDCSEPEWCQGRDFDKSEKVDFGDLKNLAECWLWQAGWYSK